MSTELDRQEAVRLLSEEYARIMREGIDYSWPGGPDFYRHVYASPQANRYVTYYKPRGSVIPGLWQMGRLPSMQDLFGRMVLRPSEIEYVAIFDMLSPTWMIPLDEFPRGRSVSVRSGGHIREPLHYGTALDPFRDGVRQAAKDGLSSEPATFGFGFALVPGAADPVDGHPNFWIMNRFGSVPEGMYWLSSIKAHGGHVYAAIFTRMAEAPLMESFGNDSNAIDLVTTMVPRMPANWAHPY
jgi:hypothetical protein